MSRRLAYRLKNISVYVGIAGYLGMIISGNFLVGAYTKLFAETLRIGYYRHTQAPDMMGLSVFFIVASIIAIIRSFL